MNELTGRPIREHTTARPEAGTSAATVNRELAALSAAINWCNVEVKSLCRAARAQKFGLILESFIRLTVNTGCRKEEMLGLEWRRVDLVNGFIYLEGVHTKAGKRRSIPLNEGALSALRVMATFRAEKAPASPWVLMRGNGERVVSVLNGFL